MSNFENLKADIHNDEELAWGWHCNLAVSALDEGVSHETSNKIAARTMMVFFGYDITKHKHYRYKSHSNDIEFLQHLIEEH